MEGYYYRAYGLVFCTELRLPELAEVLAAPADVHIRRGPLPRPSGDFPEGWYRTGAQEHMHAWPEVGVFRVRGGKEIVVDAAREAPESLVRHVLLGAVMGPLLLQRGLLPLHAATLAIRGRAFAFCAASGEGKSTLAAMLHARGYPVISDDVLGVPWQKDGPIRVPWAVPRLKLLPDAVETLGHRAETLPPVYDGLDKRALAVSGLRAADESTPLGGIFLLDRADTIEIVRLDPKIAVLHLMGQTFKLDIAVRTMGPAEHMRACASVVSRSPVFRLRRPWDLAWLPEVADAVANHCSAMPH